MTERFDHVVVGLGALGSAAAYHLARRGRRVLGLERFELGHHRGASHDTSRILRHSYHTPEYVRLTQHAYDDWAQLWWLRLQGIATVHDGDDVAAAARDALVAKYEQYRARRPEGPVLALRVERASWWSATGHLPG